MIRNISVPKKYEVSLETVLKKYNVSYEKKEVESSALWPEKIPGKFVMFLCTVSETLVCAFTLEVAELMNPVKIDQV